MVKCHLPWWESWSWGELSGSNGAQGWSLTSAAWMLYHPKLIRADLTFHQRNLVVLNTKDGQLKRGGSCLGVENVDKPGLKEAWSGRIAVCPDIVIIVLTIGCAFFFVWGSLYVFPKQRRCKQASTASPVSLVSPGCHSVSIATPGFPSLVPKFRLRRNSTGKHNEIILRPIFFIFLCFLFLSVFSCCLDSKSWGILIEKMQTTNWKVDSPFL